MRQPQGENGGATHAGGGDTAAHRSSGNSNGNGNNSNRKQSPEREGGARATHAGQAATAQETTKWPADAKNGHETQRSPSAGASAVNSNGEERTVADSKECSARSSAAEEAALVPQVAALKHIASTPSSASGSRPHSRFSHTQETPAPPAGQAWRMAPFRSNEGKTADWFSVPDLMRPVDTTLPHLAIRSPMPGMEPLYYQWPLITSHTGFCPLTEALDTMQTVLGDAAYAEAVDALAFEDALASVNLADFATIAAAVEEYNKCVTAIQQHFQDNVPKTRATTSTMHHIMNMVYNRSITDPSRLNRYKGWTEEVYGEFSFNMISEIVAKVPIKEEHTFIDLGSGVGQVVLQVAGEALCAEAIGVEKQDIPAEYAKLMEYHYLHLMAWFGKRHGKFTLTQNDFLDPALGETIRKADVIFVNNFAFGTRLNQALKEIFSECKEGCRIVSSLNFSPLDFSITHRTLSDLGSILKVEKITCRGEGVSWTSGPFDYYIQTVDRSKLEMFFSAANRMKPVLVSSQRPKAADKHMHDESGDEDEDDDDDEDDADTETSDVSPPRRRPRGRPPKNKKKQKHTQQPLSRKEQFDGFVSLLTDVVDSHLPQLAALCKQIAPLDRSVRRSRRRETKQLTETRAQIKTAIEAALVERIHEHQARLLDNVTGGDDCISIAVSAAVDNEKWLRARERIQAETTVLRRKFQHLSRLRSQMLEATRIAASLERILNAVQAPDMTSVKKALQEHDIAAVNRFLRTLQSMSASGTKPQPLQRHEHKQRKDGGQLTREQRSCTEKQEDENEEDEEEEQEKRQRQQQHQHQQRRKQHKQQQEQQEQRRRRQRQQQQAQKQEEEEEEEEREQQQQQAQKQQAQKQQHQQQQAQKQQQEEEEREQEQEPQQHQPPDQQQQKHQRQEEGHTSPAREKSRAAAVPAAAAAAAYPASLSSSSPSSSSKKRRSAHSQHRSKRPLVHTSSAGNQPRHTAGDTTDETVANAGDRTDGKPAAAEGPETETKPATAVTARLSTRELEAMWADKLRALPSPSRVHEREHVTSWNMWKLKVQKNRRRAANTSTGTGATRSARVPTIPAARALDGEVTRGDDAKGVGAGKGAFISLHSPAPVASPSSGRASLS